MFCSVCIFFFFWGGGWSEFWIRDNRRQSSPRYLSVLPAKIHLQVSFESRSVVVPWPTSHFPSLVSLRGFTGPTFEAAGQIKDRNGWPEACLSVCCGREPRLLFAALKIFSTITLLDTECCHVSCTGLCVQIVRHWPSGLHRSFEASQCLLCNLKFPCCRRQLPAGSRANRPNSWLAPLPHIKPQGLTLTFSPTVPRSAY